MLNSVTMAFARSHIRKYNEYVLICTTPVSLILVGFFAPPTAWGAVSASHCTRFCEASDQCMPRIEACVFTAECDSSNKTCAPICGKEREPCGWNQKCNRTGSAVLQGTSGAGFCECAPNTYPIPDPESVPACLPAFSTVPELQFLWRSWTPPAGKRKNPEAESIPQGVKYLKAQAYETIVGKAGDKMEVRCLLKFGAFPEPQLRMIYSDKVLEVSSETVNLPAEPKSVKEAFKRETSIDLKIFNLVKAKVDDEAVECIAEHPAFPNNGTVRKEVRIYVERRENREVDKSNAPGGERPKTGTRRTYIGGPPTGGYPPSNSANNFDEADSDAEDNEGIDSSSTDLCFGEFRYPEKCSGPTNCNYMASWEHDEESDVVKFTVTSTDAVNRWTGIGFRKTVDAPDSTFDADIIIGWWADPPQQPFLADYWWNASAEAAPKKDVHQDVLLTSATRDNGVVTLEFSRPRVSSDKQDHSLDQCLNFVYPVESGAVSRINKKIRIPEIPPEVSAEKICMRSCPSVGGVRTKTDGFGNLWGLLKNPVLTYDYVIAILAIAGLLIVGIFAFCLRRQILRRKERHEFPNGEQSQFSDDHPYLTGNKSPGLARIETRKSPKVTYRRNQLDQQQDTGPQWEYVEIPPTGLAARAAATASGSSSPGAGKRIPPVPPARRPASTGTVYEEPHLYEEVQAEEDPYITPFAAMMKKAEI